MRTSNNIECKIEIHAAVHIIIKHIKHSQKTYVSKYPNRSSYLNYCESINNNNISFLPAMCSCLFVFISPFALDVILVSSFGEWQIITNDLEFRFLIL